MDESQIQTKKLKIFFEDQIFFCSKFFFVLHPLATDVEQKKHFLKLFFSD